MGQDRSSGGSICIPVGEDEELASSIKRRLQTVPLSHCIFKVPDKLREGSEDQFSPRLVSIGPYHRSNVALKPMEDHKWRYLNDILNRKPNIDSIMENCVTALEELELRARNSYEQGEEIDRLGSKELVTMLLIDGCFLIELFLKISIKSSKVRDDPLLNTPEKLNLLRRDLILLENQIPFFVLQRLFYILPIHKSCSHNLTNLALRFFGIMIPNPVDIYQEKSPVEYLQEKFTREGNHLLDLVRSCCVPKWTKSQQETPIDGGIKGQTLDPATGVERSGIRIRRIPGADSEFDLKFEQGALWIPVLKIKTPHREILMRNAIALEQCSGDCTKFVTSYALFMRSLIPSESDARLLRRRGILREGEWRLKDFCKFFERICRGVELEEGLLYYRGIYQQVRGYKGSWRRWLCFKGMNL